MKAGVDYIGIGGGILLMNESYNKILLIKRSPKSRNTVGMWGQPGGKVDYGEKVQVGVRREIKEELDVDVENMEFLGFMDNILVEDKQHWITFIYVGVVKDGYYQNMEPDKLEEVDWFDLDNLPDNQAPRFVRGMELLKDYLNK